MKSIILSPFQLTLGAIKKDNFEGGMFFAKIFESLHAVRNEGILLLGVFSEEVLARHTPHPYVECQLLPAVLIQIGEHTNQVNKGSWIDLRHRRISEQVFEYRNRGSDSCSGRANH